MEEKKRVKPSETITERQGQVLQLIADGLDSYEIAKQLGNSKRTIDSIRLDMLRRFDATNSAHMVAIGIRKGWIK
ncbi:LuxR C-terminal-related transcriptional regulator [Ekhidna sp.]